MVLSLAGCRSTSTAPPTPAGPQRSTEVAATVSPSPSPSSPTYRFAVKGDWGYGSAEQAAVSTTMCATRAARPFDVVVTTGDNFYRPNGVATDRNYVQPERCLLERPGHVWRATWGNHDVPADSTAKVLGADRYYRWSLGPAEFFMLDSNRPADAAQTQWLRESAGASTAAWKVAVFHHPPYTTGGHPPNEGVRANWVPIFRELGVRLILTGHNHDYEHLVQDGLDYVVTGGGGAPLYPCVRSDPSSRICRAVHHFLLIEFDERTLTVESIDGVARPGDVIDTFELTDP